MTGVATRLLLVEDDPAVRRLVTDHLRRQGVAVTVASTVAAALTAVRHSAFDVTILDLALPDGSGLDVLRALRELGSASHVIILTGARSEDDRVRALELGADDYVVKPFYIRELAARILAVRRRHDTAEVSGLRFGPMAIDLAARQVTVDEVVLNLTAKEFDLLAFLAARPGHVFSRDELLRAVWQSAADWQKESTVTEHMHRLRAKVEPDPVRPRLLTTVHGAGYRFDPPSTDQADPSSTGGASPAGEVSAASAGPPESVAEGTIVVVD